MNEVISRIGADYRRWEFLQDVIEGLKRLRRSIPSKYLYDQAGSRLFAEICAQPEYYLTGAEDEILAAHAGEIAALIGGHANLVEFGSGTAPKVQRLLESLYSPHSYRAIDIDPGAIEVTRRKLTAAYPDLVVESSIADFMNVAVAWPNSGIRRGRMVALFFGSTLGNLLPHQARAFLRRARQMLEPDGYFLIGIDRVKDKACLESAYNDRAGVTAAFSLNLLRRINRQLQGDFQIGNFRHMAFFNEPLRRIEIYLESKTRQRVCLPGHEFRFERGQRIRTEYSYKYSISEFGDLASTAGFSIRRRWSDSRDQFDLYLLAVGHDIQDRLSEVHIANGW